MYVRGRLSSEMGVCFAEILSDDDKERTTTDRSGDQPAQQPTTRNEGNILCVFSSTNRKWNRLEGTSLETAEACTAATGNLQAKSLSFGRG